MIILLFSLVVINFRKNKVVKNVLLAVDQQHLIDSQVFARCPPLQNVSRVQAVAESRPAREIINVLKITIKFTLEANNITRGNASYIRGHCIEKAYFSPSEAIIGK